VRRPLTHSRVTGRLFIVLLAMTGALAAAGCSDTLTEPATSKHQGTGRPAGKDRQRRADATRPKPQPRTGSALAALDHLRVKGRAPKTGYDREQFGGDWAAVNGCGMRDRVLARDLEDNVHDGRSDCEIESGLLADPYTATRIRFVRGGGSEVDIDHVVALGDAWQKGAQQWTYQQRVRFANDPLNLLAVDASANRQKGDSDAASWLPPNTSYRCSYISRQIAVKRRYRAWVTGAEKTAMSRVLSGCPSETLPTARRVRVRIASNSGAAPEATPKPTGDRATARYFENCDAVRAAGLAPLARGDGLYEHNTHMDRDGDGVACE
jgi:uncharacterized protein DUF1524/excalibur calcium-binding domain-containing protein